MKQFYFLTFVLFFVGGVLSVNAQDLIVLKTGSMIEGKVIEISPTEIRYKRADHLDGPTIVLPANNVLSIRYANGKTDIINGNTTVAPTTPGRTTATPPAPGGTTGTTAAPGGTAGNALAQQLGLTSQLQATLNTMPAIRIAGNNLKFDFSSDTWTAKLNGENFSTGTIASEMTGTGAILTLKQTHIWPGAAAGKAVGKLASRIPGGAVAAGALNAAGGIPGLDGAVEASGTQIVLEYKAGPPASLKFVSTGKTTEASAKQNTPGTAGNGPGTAGNIQPADNAVVWEVNGHSYLVVDQSMTWDEAKVYAENMGGYLAVIEDSKEQSFIRNLFMSGTKDFYWLGGYREGNSWQWVNGANFRYKNWLPGTPDNLLRKEDKLGTCRKVGHSSHSVGQWDDRENKGGEWIGFIIEWDAQ